ncbi:transcription termination factor 5, mitochondrial-like [Macrobrachium nipponense]|uniref:transcription termination factor 5, mitochondrial-like n=1 Tax=Macrobrachium nipponense TaxID=159736 RepID=UPI0030C83DC2
MTVMGAKPNVALRLLKFGHMRMFGTSIPSEGRLSHTKKPQRKGIQSLKPGSRISLIMNYFNISRTRAYAIINSEPRLQEVDVHELSHNISTLKSNGLDPDDVRRYLQLLYFCPLTVEHRIAMFQELGLLNLSAFHYTKFAKFFKSSVALLKSYKLLENDYDIAGVLHALGVPEAVHQKFGLPGEVDNLSLAEVHKCLNLAYQCWLLQCEPDAIDYIHKTYPPSQTKSMRLQNVVVKRLIENWDFSIDEILRHGYLLCCSPINVQRIENSIKHLCHADPKKVAHLTPRILTLPPQQLCEISNLLVEAGVTETAVLQTPQIFSLQPRTVKERIQEIQLTPEFSGINSHPRMLRLIHYNTKARRRLDVLRQIKDTRAVPSLNVITGDQDRFNKYIAIGYLRVNRKDIVTYLAKHFKVKSSVIRKNLRLPSHKQQVSVVSVKSNVTYLSHLGFLAEQMLSSLEVLLYPPDIVVQQVQDLMQRLDSYEVHNIVSLPHALQLLLYYLDKEMPY